MSKTIYQPGIYNIINTVDLKHYIGSAVDLQGRWYLHRWNLTRQTHHNRHLQNAWNLYGPDAFEFTELEYVACEADLTGIEQLYIDACWDSGMLYNINRHARNRLGTITSEETKRKQSAAKKGKSFTDEHRRNISLGKQGQTHSDETKKRMSESRLGHPVSEDTRRKQSKPRSEEGKRNMSAAQKGRTHSEETKRKQSEVKKGKTHTEEAKRNMSLAGKLRAERERQAKIDAAA